MNTELQYGMGGETFQKQLVVGGTYLPIDTIERIKAEYRNTYAYIINYHSTTGSNCNRRIPNYTLMGTPHWSLRFTEMVNRPNQASGTKEVLQEFLRLCYRYRLISEYDVELFLSVHDSVLFSYHTEGMTEESVKTVATMIAYLAQMAWFNVLEFGYNRGYSHFADVPMPIGVGVGATWGEVDKNEDYVTIGGKDTLDNREEVTQWLQSVMEWRQLPQEETIPLTKC